MDTRFSNGPPRRNPLPQPTVGDSWSNLAKGQPLGKKVVVPFKQNDGGSFSPVSILQIHGDDHDAKQINVTLSPPSIIPVELTTLTSDLQQATNEQTNREVILIPGNFPGYPDPFQWVNPTAIIEWGIGGASERAEVDLMEGVCVNLCASFVRVWAVIGNPGTLAGTDAAYVLSAFIGPGWPKTLGAQRTFWVGDMNANVESDAFPIPKFSKKVTLIGGNTAENTTPALTTGTIRFWQSINLSGAGRRNVGNVFFSGNNPQPCPIPNGAAYFSILAGTESETLYGALFDLSI